ncbi:DUF3040 domain-containing protein [Streptomyces sp. NPDC127079]|uniref:DUF3040 domain-containing protein n=1 Tax=Streptomyces sp. NPDC127079 TaxID=3347132 RepID=UPI00364DAD19
MADSTGPSNDVRLSRVERLAWLRIEADLRRDRRFARRMRRGGGGPPARFWLRSSVALLTVASVVLAVVGIRTSDPVVLWCFAAVWPLTLLQGARLLCRASRDSGRRDRPWI